MMSKLHNIRGRDLSEDTIADCVSKQLGIVFPEKKSSYQFQEGDVTILAGADKRDTRIICRDADGTLKSFDTHGDFCSTGQDQFEHNEYEKIGTLSDYLLA